MWTAASVLACSMMALQVAGLGGCATRNAADPHRGAELHLTGPVPLEFPARDVDKANRTIGMQPGKHKAFLAGLDGGAGNCRPIRFSAPVIVKRREQAGQGIVCEVKRLDREEQPDDPATFLFFSSDTPVMGVPGKPNQEIDPRDRDVEPGTPLDAMVFRVYPAREGETKAIAIVLRPISGAAYTKSTLNELRDRGFTVLETGWSFGARGIGITRDALNDEALDAVGTDVAKIIDARLAETAFGVEAMLEVLKRDRSDLSDAPIAVVGFSAGAIASPTVCARLGNKVKAAVLVGGGVNVLRIAQTSTLSDFGLTIRRSGKPLTEAQIDRTCKAYLKASHLDPYHAAPLMSRLPMLMLHAKNDSIVPAVTGEVLHERVGRPERWTFPYGHELLFLRLSNYDSQIAGWLQNAMASSIAQRPEPLPAQTSAMLVRR
jgi:alpha-beta hydrolase superfamily lysophospholipase